MKDLLGLPEAYRRPEWAELPVPGRPWWRSRPGKSLIRRDGVFGHVFGWPNDPWSPEQCVAYDMQHPIAHPGVRLGQIWLLQWPDDFLVQLVSNHDVERALLKGYTPHGHDLRFTSDLSIFLLHDPCRPDLAPWNGFWCCVQP